MKLIFEWGGLAMGNNRKFKIIKQKYIENSISNDNMNSIEAIFEVFKSEMGYGIDKFVEDKDFPAMRNKAYHFSWSNDADNMQSFVVELMTGDIRLASIDSFLNKLRKSIYTWGMLMNGNEFLLFHKETFNNADGKEKTPILRVKLQGEIGKEYFEFFSFENLFVNKGTMYFCDLISYKANGFRGSETSWRAYESVIKRFLLYMVNAKKEYDVNHYKRLELNDFISFIRETSGKKGKEITTMNTVKNAYRYISAFMHYICEDNKEYHKEISEVVSCFSDFKEQKIDNIFDEECLKEVVCYIKGQKHRTRNLVIFYLSLCLGLERKWLCGLKWENWVDGKLILNGREKIVPAYVNKLLMQLYQENQARNIPLDFMFYTYNGEHSEPVKYTTINEVFASIERIDLSNKVYSQYTPANIRKALAEYFFVECGFELARVIDLLGIDANNFSRYITNDMIQRAVQKWASDECMSDALIRKIDSESLEDEFLL